MILEAVRQAALPGVWSQGVRLALELALAQGDRALAGPQRDAVPLANARDVLEALSQADVELDGKKVTTSGELLMPRAIVDDAEGGGFTLRIESDPAMTGIVARGVARCGDVLR